MSDHETFMTLALKEARRGQGRTRPNPMVGCVVVKDGEVIAKGYHARAGEDHAEVVALRRAGEAAKGADVYVTLEPCNHHGRTPPCTTSLIEAGVARVFVGFRDPNELVDGRGIRKLRRAGIQVETGILKEQCRVLNESFNHFIGSKRPFMIAKIAQSMDGRVATRTGESKWITGAKARKFGHQLRHECDGIMVGIGTVLADDPSLTCRGVRGGVDPVRIIVDSQARTPLKSKVLKVNRDSDAPTWIFVDKKADDSKVQALEKAGAEVIRVRSKAGRLSLNAILDELGKRDLLSVLVEGGPSLMGSLFDGGFISKVHAFVAPMVIGGEQATPSVGGQGVRSLADACRLTDLKLERLGSDVLLTGYSKGS